MKGVIPGVLQGLGHKGHRRLQEGPADEQPPAGGKGSDLVPAGWAQGPVHHVL